MVKVIFSAVLFYPVLLAAVRRFVALSGQVGVKGSEPMVRELMTILRRSGFSSSQISELSGLSWSDTLVRQYTGDWGGVDDSLGLQRDSLMASLRGLASSGMDVGDVERVLSLDNSVRLKGSSLEEVAEMNSNLAKLDLQRGEIGKLVTLSRELEDKGLNPAMVQRWMRLDEELVEAGFNKRARDLIHEASEKYGGVAGMLEMFIKFNDLGEIVNEHILVKKDLDHLKSEINRLEDEKDRLDTEIRERQEMIDAANKATLTGFNVVTLGMASVLSKKLDGPYRVMDAIGKYSSLKEMDDDLSAKKAELEKLQMEISKQNQILGVLMHSLDEVKKEYYRNIDVRQVVELLVNPSGIKMDRMEVVRLLIRVLESSAQRIDESPEIMPLPSPVRDAAYREIKLLAERLRQLIETPQGP